MMPRLNPGLILRSLRETALSTAVLAGLLGVMSGILAYALPQVQARFMQRSFIPPAVRQFRNMFLGVDSQDAGVAEVAFAIAWSHPVVLALLFTQTIIVCTRVLAGEVERGTIDILLGLPVSRATLFLSETAAWLITAAITLGCIFLGSYIGAQWIRPEYRPDWGKLAMVLANLTLVYTLVGAAALLAAMAFDRRGRAVLFVLVIIVGSLLVNFLELLWEPARNIAWLSVLHYYRPIGILRTGEWPVRDLAILGGLTLAAWIGAWTVLSRRAITTS